MFIPIGSTDPAQLDNFGWDRIHIQYNSSHNCILRHWFRADYISYVFLLQNFTGYVSISNNVIHYRFHNRIFWHPFHSLHLFIFQFQTAFAMLSNCAKDIALLLLYMYKV